MRTWILFLRYKSRAMTMPCWNCSMDGCATLVERDSVIETKDRKIAELERLMARKNKFWTAEVGVGADLFGAEAPARGRTGL